MNVLRRLFRSGTGPQPSAKAPPRSTDAPQPSADAKLVFANAIPGSAIDRIILTLGTLDFDCTSARAAEFYRRLNPTWPGTRPIEVRRVDAQTAPEHGDIALVCQSALEAKPPGRYLTFVQYFNFQYGAGETTAAAFLTLVPTDGEPTALMLGVEPIAMSG